MQTQTEKLRKQEKERDFFCIVRDAFRVFARHSAIALESLGFCWSRARNSCLDSHRTNGSFFRYLAIGHQRRPDDRHLPHGVSDPEDAKQRRQKQCISNWLIRAFKRARNELVDLEDLSDEELKKLEKQFRSMRKRAEDDGIPSRHAATAELR